MRGQLLLLVGLILGVTPLVNGVVFSAALDRVASRGMDERARAVADIIASQAFVGEGSSREGLSEILSEVLALGAIDYVRVRDVSGMEVASVGRTGPKTDPSRLSRASVRAPVYRGGRRAGSVEVGTSASVGGATHRRAIALSALTSLALLIAAMSIAVLVTRKVTDPLYEVIATADRVASGETDLTAPSHYRGEIGRLAHSFNEMLQKFRRSREATDSSRLQLQQVLESLPAAVAMFDLRGRYVYVNPAEVPDPEGRKRAVGRTLEEVGRRSGVPQDVIEQSGAALEECAREGRTVTLEQAVVSDHGSLRFLRFFSPIMNIWGETAGVVSYGLDISDLRAAEEELRDTQEQLAQAQRLESIGRLAGGIAHDFNNLLTHIIGYADLILLDIEEEDPRRSDVAEIQSAARKAASLTQQLLAFSRKQVRQTRLIQINDVIQGTHSILTRILGEGADLRLDLGDDIGAVRADPSQLEQILVNLTVNARDAMGDRGTLRVRSRMAWLTGEEEMVGGAPEPGAFVELSVEDSGSGMDADTIEQIFEPFFTTKGPNEGTGLGLATVYGIVKQNGGCVAVRSTPGEGTQFRIFLPRELGEATALEEIAADATLATGSETILVVDDQEGLADMARKILGQAGYRVLVALSTDEAIEVATSHEGDIDLLLTDVVMPGMSGPELVDRLSSMRYALRVLYMSGYTDDLLAPHGVLDDETLLLHKPFGALQLTRAVRKALEPGSKVAPSDRPSLHREPSRLEG